MRGRFEYAVRYRRAGWTSRQVRFFQSWQGARRYRAKLTRGGDQWAPLAEVTVERREVGPWTEVDL